MQMSTQKCMHVMFIDYAVLVDLKQITHLQHSPCQCRRLCQPHFQQHTCNFQSQLGWHRWVSRSIALAFLGHWWPPSVMCRSAAASPSWSGRWDTGCHPQRKTVLPAHGPPQSRHAEARGRWADLKEVTCFTPSQPLQLYQGDSQRG